MAVHVPAEKKYNQSITDCHELQHDHLRFMYRWVLQKDIDGAITNHKTRDLSTLLTPYFNNMKKVCSHFHKKHEHDHLYL